MGNMYTVGHNFFGSYWAVFGVFWYTLGNWFDFYWFLVFNATFSNISAISCDQF